jgi:hypothetical protein
MAILFDGSANGDHYSMSGASHPQPNDFTFKIRARFRSWTVGISGLGGILFSSWLESTGGNDAVLITNSAAGVITVRSISGGSIVASATTSALSLNTNYEFLLSYTSNTTNGIKLYINGVLAAQCNSPAAIAYDDTYFGGGDSQASDAYWNCWTYWSGAHSAAEALAEVNQDTPQKSSGLWDTWNPTSYQAVTYTGNINSKPFTNQSAGDTYVVDDLPISFPTRAIAVSLAIPAGPFPATRFASFRQGSTPTVNPDVTVAVTGQSAAFAAGTLTPSTSVALAGQADAFSAGTLAPSTSVALTGQSAAFAAGTLSPSTSVALAGQSAAFAAGAFVPSIDVSLAGAQATFTAGTVGFEGDVTVSLTGASATFTAGTLSADTAALVEQSSGGWAFWMSYEQEQARRRHEKRKREQLEEETEAIEESVDRDIARFLREQEAQDARRAELDRLGNIARRHADAAEARAYSERVAVALERAIEKGTFSALEALDREIERAQTEEELVLVVSQVVALQMIAED